MSVLHNYEDFSLFGILWASGSKPVHSQYSTYEAQRSEVGFKHKTEYKRFDVKIFQFYIRLQRMSRDERDTFGQSAAHPDIRRSELRVALLIRKLH